MNYKIYPTSICLTLALVYNLVYSFRVYAQEKNDTVEKATIRFIFGQQNRLSTSYWVRLQSGSKGLIVSIPTGVGIEKDDQVATPSLLTAGAGDIDALTAEVTWPKPTAPLRKLASHEGSYAPDKDAMWGYLLENGSYGQAERLKDDPWQKVDAPLLTVKLSEDGTKGFSIGIEQLLRHGAMWLPEHGIFVTMANKPVEFKQHLAQLKGQRTLQRIKAEPEATLTQFKKLWEDVGNPIVWNKPWETSLMGTRGHLIVTTAAHGSLYKFALDRWANVRPDFASPHKFRFDLLWPGSIWKRQGIMDGLPLILTNLENKGQQCQIEQFAAPLNSNLPTERGEVESVLLTKVKVWGKAGVINMGFSVTTDSKHTLLEVKKIDSCWVIAQQGTGNIWLTVETPPELSLEVSKSTLNGNNSVATFYCVGKLMDGETREILLKLPSPAVPASHVTKLIGLNFTSSRKATIHYWEDWLKQGARFEVPEKAVNTLFRANLWHSLILPRHRKGENGESRIDLPYANTAYGQQNVDWPINQGVYVDYMIYGLRGYWKVAEEEFAAMFQSQQQPDGRIAGYANWGVYSPGHLYAIAQNYLLSKDRASFERLLPQSLKTLDWCLSQIAKANMGEGASGLIRAPLNDLTHEEREWAFPQAYFVAGLELFSRALVTYGHPRAEEVRMVAAKMKGDVTRAFARSSVKAPLVQLADGTWNNYVPSDAMTSRRLLDEWYPTDVDCGPLHLSRLNAIDANGWLTTAMLHDHEDNLFFKNQGAANEPVYVQQGTAYLLRDEPEASIRAFYSLMACGFSHEQLSPLEHRWAWGQYYGPPSTDGAWFELYRKMLIHELDEKTLLLGQAIPRSWLEDGKKIEVEQAPTYFGKLSFTIESRASNDEIKATIELLEANEPEEMLVRLRHPQKKRMQSVVVNGKEWKDFDVKQEWIRLTKIGSGKHAITVKY